MFLISDLCALLETYLEEYQVAEVYQAYLFGAEAHEGQRRQSGEPYIYHPLAVARILAEMRMDHQSIIAAILHDVIEDTPTRKDELVKEFGDEVAELVDGVSKLTQIQFENKAEAQAENFRKMVLAMVKDIRVILIKLADRLHNMRTLGALLPEKRRRIARETLDIYVPIANRLGMNAMRVELQDLGFAALYPVRYRILRESVKKARGNRKEIVQKIEDSLGERLRQEDLRVIISGREKHLYSIYLKMRNKRLSFSEVMDVYAFRIVVDKVDTCYRALGVVHNLYKPVPGRFKDYIAIPKANGYQSLHTVLFGPYGVPVEVQIRTEDMDKVANAGIAAHWLYKDGEGSGPANQARAREWLRGLLEMQKNSGNSLEFLENVKIDLFPDGVFVFTPKGDIMELPRGVTAVDFAYAVHTDIGHSCVAAKVDRRLVPLRTVLQTGQQVEIITAPGAKPNPAWLNFVVTGKARSNIRNYLKNLKRDEAISLGRRLLERSLAVFDVSLEQLPKQKIDNALAEFKLDSLDDLLEDIGLGGRMAVLVARQLAGKVEEAPRPKDKKDMRGQARLKNMLSRYAPNLFHKEKAAQPQPLAIKGTEGIVVTYAKCCRPIPGDRIVGFVSAGRGIVIHVENCKNVAEYRDRPEKWIDVQWEDNVEGDFPVEIRVDVVNQRGVLATVASAIAELEANIENVNVEEKDGRHTEMVFVITVRSRRHLAEIIRHIRSVERVVRITRTKS